MFLEAYVKILKMKMWQLKSYSSDYTRTISCDNDGFAHFVDCIALFQVTMVLLSFSSIIAQYVCYIFFHAFY